VCSKALRGEVDCLECQGARMRALADAALARATVRGWDLAQDPGRLRIQTIDSFNFSAGNAAHVTAKAGGALVITERPHELYTEPPGLTLAAADDDPHSLEDVSCCSERLDNIGATSSVARGHAGVSASLAAVCVGSMSLELLCARISDSSRRNSTRPSARSLFTSAHCTRIEPGANYLTLARWGVICAPCGLETARIFTLTAKCEWRKPKGITRAAGLNMRVRRRETVGEPLLSD